MNDVPMTPREAAQLAVAEAMMRRDEMMARIAKADTDLADATSAHARLILDAPAGGLTVQATMKADGLRQAAGAVAGVLRQTLPGLEAAVSVANEQVAAATRDEGTALWRRVVADRIVLAERVDRLWADLMQAEGDWRANSRELNDAWNLGRIPDGAEIESLRDMRVFARSAPISLQTPLVASGVVHHVLLAVGTRLVWGSLPPGGAA